MRKIYFGNEKISNNNMDKLVDLLSATSFLFGIHSIIEQQLKVQHVPTYVYKLIAHTDDALIKKFLNTELEGNETFFFVTLLILCDIHYFIFCL